MVAELSTLVHLCWVFLKVGFVFFGGGFLLVPTLHRELVVQLRWLTPAEFVNGVAMSQMTPGPVAILATFCGYHRAGVAGAVLSTFFVFLPPFALMLVFSRVYSRFQQLPLVQEVMSVFPPAIVGLLLATAYDMGRHAIVSPVAAATGLVALVAMARYNVSPVVLIAVGALVGIWTGA